jgi:biotin operon repressor
MAKRIDCYICGKGNLTRNEIGLNKKLIGQDIKKFHCLQCLADYLEVSVEELEERIVEFKDAGCSLFE